MSKIDRAWVRRGEGEFPDTAVIVQQQRYAEPLKREGVKLRRVLWGLAIVQAIGIAASIAAVCYSQVAAHENRLVRDYLFTNGVQHAPSEPGRKAEEHDSRDRDVPVHAGVGRPGTAADSEDEDVRGE